MTDPAAFNTTIAGKFPQSGAASVGSTGNFDLWIGKRRYPCAYSPPPPEPEPEPTPPSGTQNESSNGLWVDVYDAGGNRLGDGPVTSVVSASVKRVLDGAGSISVVFPATDQRALDLLQNERHIRIFVEHDSTTRELGRGVIRQLRLDVRESNMRLRATGPDELDALSRKSVLLGRKYDNQGISTIVNNLLTLVSGWTATVDGGLGNLSTRFDGSNVLKALLTVVEQQGLHLRAGTSSNSIEVGAFGADSGLLVYGPLERVTSELSARDDMLLIETLSQTNKSAGVVNWIVPLGAGNGEAALTLEHSTRTAPYAIQSMTGPDGRTLYYLSDSASIAGYGQIERILVFKDIAPVENNATDVELAANALYDAAAAKLERISQLQETYKFACRKPRQTIRPGDKIAVRYKGVIERDGQPLTYADVDDDFWVLAVRERVGLDGIRLSLEVCTVDQHALDAAKIIVGALDALQVRDVAVQPYYSKSGFTYVRQLDDTHTATVPIKITDATMFLQRALVRVKTRPFRALASGASSGGAHRHQMWDSGAVVSPAAPKDVGYVCLDADAPGGNGTVHYWRQSGSASTPSELWTFGSSDTHSHTLTYGINDDTEYPDTLRVSINGVDRTSALGGPWGSGGSAVDVTLDVTDYINAAATLQQEHTVQFSCDGGQGEVEVLVELYEVIQTIAVT